MNIKSILKGAGVMFTSILAVIPVTALSTIGLCFLACLSVAIIMRFFIKRAIKVLEDWLYKFNDKESKQVAVYEACKNIACMLIAGVLTFLFLNSLWGVCTFPAENNKALEPLFFIPMFALQFFLDKNLKKLALKLFNIEKEEKAPKQKKQKIYVKKIPQVIEGKVIYEKHFYTKDENGNEVEVTE